MVYKAPKEYRTNEFVIRPFQTTDVNQIVKQNIDSFEHLQRYMPWADKNACHDSVSPIVEGFIESYQSNTDFTLGIFEPNDETLLGGTGFHPRNHDYKEEVAEIGMWVSASACGRGLGTKVLKAMVHWGFYEWHWRRLWWQCDERNEASAKVALKAGLSFEGIHQRDFRNHFGEWRNSKIFALVKRSSQDLGEPFKVRDLLASDAKQMGALHADAWHDTYRGLFSDHDLDEVSSKSKHHQWLDYFEHAKDHHMLKGVFSGDKLVGMAMWGSSRIEGLRDDWEIYMINIPGDYQRKGLGRLLMEQALTDLSPRKKSIYLWVLELNERAIAFYRSFGFTETNQTKGVGTEVERLFVRRV